jgi:hypothetical protein
MRSMSLCTRGELTQSFVFYVPGESKSLTRCRSFSLRQGPRLSAWSRSGGPAAGTRLVSGPGDPGQQGWGDGQLSHALLSPLVDGLMLPRCLPSAVDA